MTGPDLGEGIGAALLLLVPFAFVATIVWIVLRRRTDRIRLQVDVKKEIIAKFGSTSDLRDFLKSEEGQAILKPVGLRPERTIRERAILRIGLGIIFVIVGGGLSVLAHYADQPQILVAVEPGANPPPGPFVEIPPGMGLPAAAILLVGIGLIVSSIFILLVHPREDPSLRSGDSRS